MKTAPVKLEKHPGQQCLVSGPVCPRTYLVNWIVHFVLQDGLRTRGAEGKRHIVFHVSHTVQLNSHHQTINGEMRTTQAPIAQRRIKTARKGRKTAGQACRVKVTPGEVGNILPPTPDTPTPQKTHNPPAKHTRCVTSQENDGFPGEAFRAPRYDRGLSVSFF